LVNGKEMRTYIRPNDFFVERFFTDDHPSFLRTHGIAAYRFKFTFYMHTASLTQILLSKESTSLFKYFIKDCSGKLSVQCVYMYA